MADDSTGQCRERAAWQAGSSDRGQVLKGEFRYLAARNAALAASGAGNDTADLGDAERTRWRANGRTSGLRADLQAWAGTPDDSHDLTRQMLKLWRDEADFAPIREPEALKRLPAGERADWNSLWDEVRRALHE